MIYNFPSYGIVWYPYCIEAYYVAVGDKKYKLFRNTESNWSFSGRIVDFEKMKVIVELKKIKPWNASGIKFFEYII